MRKRLLVKWIAVLAFFSFPFLLGAAWAQTETVLYSFCALNDCTDGETPDSGLVFDQQGNLYGTTFSGGANRFCGTDNNEGCGMVFKVTPDGTETVLYSFCAQKDCTDGSYPDGGLTFDQEGNLYGVTHVGGSRRNRPCWYDGASGCGVVFKFTPEGKYTVLYKFCMRNNCSDGMNPSRRLLFDQKGNLYGTTVSGGANRFCGWNDEGCGTVFKLTPEGKQTVLYSFCAKGGTNCTDGANPFAGLTFDRKGNLYGTALRGGAGCIFGSYGCGVVFKLSPKGKYTVLHTFCTVGDTCSDGALPEAGVIVDHEGTVYGTTTEGGSHDRGVGHEWGVVFKLSPEGKETVLHNFCRLDNCTDGLEPRRITFGPEGNMYGTTWGGGVYGWGTVFKVTPDGKETVLYSFCSQGYPPCADGFYPSSGLIFDKQGNMYGTTSEGGASGFAGVVFKLTP